MVQLVRKLIARVALPLVVLSLLWLSWQFVSLAQAQGLSALWNRQGAGGMGVLPALDLVIAMPISWLPLVADYARHGKSGGAALRGTWLGYALANMWCYSLGVLVALTLPCHRPGAGAAAGAGRADCAVADPDRRGGQRLWRCVFGRRIGPQPAAALEYSPLGAGRAALCTGLALVLPMHSLEPFLLLLSSVFVPLFGVILGRLAFGTHAPALLAQARVVNALPVALWLAGIAVYHLAPKVLPGAGSALPALAFSFALAWATRPKAR